MITLGDVVKKTAANKAGFSKLVGACHIAVADSFDYIWINSCCIDKSSSAELSEAINSMFSYYREAVVFAFIFSPGTPHFALCTSSRCFSDLSPLQDLELALDLSVAPCQVTRILLTFLFHSQDTTRTSCSRSSRFL